MWLATGPVPPSLPEYRGRSLFDTLLYAVLILAGLTVAWLALRGTLWPLLGAGVGALFAAGWWPAVHVPGGPWLAWALRLAALTGLLALAAAASRWYWWHRRRASMVWYEIQLFQDDTTEPARVRGVFDQLWDALFPRQRWLGAWAPYRWFTGTTWYTYAIVRDGTVDDRIHLLLGAPGDVMDRVLHAWQNVYQNVRFAAWPHPFTPPTAHLVRWGVRYRTWLRLTDLGVQLRDDARGSPVAGALAGCLAAGGGPA